MEKCCLFWDILCCSNTLDSIHSWYTWHFVMTFSWALPQFTYQTSEIFKICILKLLGVKFSFYLLVSCLLSMFCLWILYTISIEMLVPVLYLVIQVILSDEIIVTHSNYGVSQWPRDEWWLNSFFSSMMLYVSFQHCVLFLRHISDSSSDSYICHQTRWNCKRQISQPHRYWNIEWVYISIDVVFRASEIQITQLYNMNRSRKLQLTWLLKKLNKTTSSSMTLQWNECFCLFPPPRTLITFSLQSL